MSARSGVSYARYLALCVTVSALTACSASGDDAAPRPSTTLGTSTAPTTLGPSTAPTTLGASTAPTTLGASTAATTVTADVAFDEAFGAFIGGGDSVPDCEGIWEAVPSTPYIGSGGVSFETLTRGLDLQICFAGFDVTAPISLTVIDPAGAERVLRVSSVAPTGLGPTELLVDADGDAGLTAGDGYLATEVGQLDPATPLGDYRLAASQGVLHAEVTATVESYPLHDPNGGWLKPQQDWTARSESRPGDVLQILLLGFGADVTVPLALYRNTGGAVGEDAEAEFVLVGALGEAAVGHEGWAYHDVVIPDALGPGDVEPEYCIATTPELAPAYCERDLDVVFDIVP